MTKFHVIIFEALDFFGRALRVVMIILFIALVMPVMLLTRLVNGDE